MAAGNAFVSQLKKVYEKGQKRNEFLERVKEFSLLATIRWALKKGVWKSWV